MTTIKAVIKGRHVAFDVPRDWPDGTEVQIQPVSPPLLQTLEVQSSEGVDGSRFSPAQEQRLRKSAEAIKDLYEPGGALTEWTELDGEDFHDDSPDR